MPADRVAEQAEMRAHDRDEIIRRLLGDLQRDPRIALTYQTCAHIQQNLVNTLIGFAEQTDGYAAGVLANAVFTGHC
jgi:hypothetical protein